MDRATKTARFDRATGSVIVDYIRQDGTPAKLQIDIDAAEAIMDAVNSARTSPPLVPDDASPYAVRRFTMSPIEGELHMILQVEDGRESTFVFAAPTSCRDLQRFATHFPATDTTALS